MGRSSRAFLFVACLAMAGASVASAAPLARFTSFTVFGDSLSDPSNLFSATGGLIPPSPPYSDGRVSNGPVWAEYVAEGFTKRNLGDGNYASAYARALPANPNLPPSANLPTGLDVPDLPDQIGFFTLDPDKNLGKRPLASLWFGANDVFFNGIPSGKPAAVGVAASNAVADGAMQLAGLGFNDFLIFNLPDIGGTPAFSLFNLLAKPDATEATLAFNQNLAARVEELREDGLNVIDVDMFALFRDLIENPETYGVNDVKLPCLFPSPEDAAASEQPMLCEGEPQLGRAFFDQVHPNLVIHQQIAGQVDAVIAPIPLPATALLLMAGLAGMAAARRRV